MTKPWLEDEDEAIHANAPLAGMIGEVLTKRVQLLETRAVLDEQLKTINSELRQLEEVTLVELMDQMNVSALTDTSGAKLKLDQVVTASLTNPEVRAKALAYLREHQLGDLITTDVTTRFRKGQEGLATEAARALAERYGPTNVIQEENVNTSSYKAAIKELMAQGASVPFGDIGVFVVRKVVVKS